MTEIKCCKYSFDLYITKFIFKKRSEPNEKKNAISPIGSYYLVLAYAQICCTFWRRLSEKIVDLDFINLDIIDTTGVDEITQENHV